MLRGDLESRFYEACLLLNFVAILLCNGWVSSLAEDLGKRVGGFPVSMLVM